jgi:ribosomal protein L34
MRHDDAPPDSRAPDACLTHAQYEALERAITDGRRIVVTRRGTEFVVVPLRLRTVTGREVLDARHPTTGDSLTLVLDELDALEPIPGR